MEYKGELSSGNLNFAVVTYKNYKILLYIAIMNWLEYRRKYRSYLPQYCFDKRKKNVCNIMVFLSVLLP